MLVRHDLAGGAQAAFTDRYGGVSAPPYAELNLGAGSGDDPHAVTANRSRVASALGLDPAAVAWMRQQHGSVVAHIRDTPEGSVPAVDGLVTATRGVALAVLVADCLPLVLADPSAGVVGVAHAGRRGLARGIVPALVSRAEKLGAWPGRMVAMLGPAVCGCCYEVPKSMRAEVAGAVPDAWCDSRWGAPGLDIPAGAEGQLRGLGVMRIHRDRRCTAESAEMYSHRRDGRTGRSAAYAWLESRGETSEPSGGACREPRRDAFAGGHGVARRPPD